MQSWIVTSAIGCFSVGCPSRTGLAGSHTQTRRRMRSVAQRVPGAVRRSARQYYAHGANGSGWLLCERTRWLERATARCACMEARLSSIHNLSRHSDPAKANGRSGPATSTGKIRPTRDTVRTPLSIRGRAVRMCRCTFPIRHPFALTPFLVAPGFIYMPARCMRCPHSPPSLRPLLCRTVSAGSLRRYRLPSSASPTLH